MSVRQKKIIRITAICIVAVLFLLAGTEIWITRKVETVIEQTIRKQGGIPRKIHIGSVSFNPWSRTARLNEIKFQIEFFREKTDIDLKIDHIVIEKLRLHGKNGIEFTTIDLETPILSMTRHGTENPTDSIRNNTTKPIERTSGLKNTLSGTVRVTNGSLHIFEEKNGKQIHHAFQNLSFTTGRLDNETFTRNSTAAVHGLHLSIRQVQYQFDENALRLEADTIVLSFTRDGHVALWYRTTRQEQKRLAGRLPRLLSNGYRPVSETADGMSIHHYPLRNGAFLHTLSAPGVTAFALDAALFREALETVDVLARREQFTKTLHSLDTDAPARLLKQIPGKRHRLSGVWRGENIYIQTPTHPVLPDSATLKLRQHLRP